MLFVYSIMVEFLPFRGLTPHPDVLEKVVSRPFDSYTKDESNAILSSVPESFLHVIVPVQHASNEASLPYKEVLKRGKEKWEIMQQNQWMLQEEKPCFYLYQQVKEGHVYTGIIGLAHIDDYMNGNIKKHEQTLEHKEELLKDYLDTIDLHAEPVYLVFEDNELWADLKAHFMHTTPQASFTGPDGYTHTYWKVQDETHIQQVLTLFSQQKSLYIADGHHRCAASYLYGIDKRNKTDNPEKNAASDYFLAAALPESEAKLYEFSRLVKDLNSLSEEQFISALTPFFHIQKSQVPVVPVCPHEFGICLRSGWYVLNLKQEFLNGNSLKDQLDPELINTYVFGPVLNIYDLRKDKRVKFLGGKTDVQRLENAVLSGKYAAAFTLYPVKMSLFKQMADAGEMMPPKSTFFEPKFLSGLFIYSLTDKAYVSS